MMQEPISSEVADQARFCTPAVNAEDPQHDVNAGLQLIRSVLDNPDAIEIDRRIDFILQAISGLQTVQEIQTAQEMLGAYLKDDAVPKALLERQRMLNFLSTMEPAKRDGSALLDRLRVIEKFKDSDLHALNTLTLDTIMNIFVEQGMSADQAAKEASVVLLHLDGIRAQIIRKSTKAVTDGVGKSDLKTLNQFSFDAVDNQFTEAGMIPTEVVGSLSKIKGSIADRRMWLVDDEVIKKIGELKSNEASVVFNADSIESIQIEFRNAGMTEDEVNDAVGRVREGSGVSYETWRSEVHRRLDVTLNDISDRIRSAGIPELNSTLSIDSIFAIVRAVDSNETALKNSINIHRIREKIRHRRNSVISDVYTQTEDRLQGADLHAFNASLSLVSLELQFRDAGMTENEAKNAVKSLTANHRIYRRRVIDSLCTAKVAGLQQSGLHAELDQDALVGVKQEFLADGMTQSEVEDSVRKVSTMWKLKLSQRR